MPFVLQKNNCGADINIIEWEDDLLRIDFVAKAHPNCREWWIKLCPEIFIRPVGSGIKLPLVKSVGIPIAPLRFIFPHRNFEKKFSLYFKLPPPGVQFIDIIERGKYGRFLLQLLWRSNRKGFIAADFHYRKQNKSKLMNSLIELKLIEFELRYRPYFDYASSLGNYNGFFGPPAILNYMIWQSLFAKNVTMSFCWGDDGRDNYYLFQDFLNEKSIELPADEVDAIIKKIDKIANIDGWRFHKGKKLGYKTLLPDFGGKMIDEFLNEVETKLAKYNINKTDTINLYYEKDTI